jgi:hypothetical protein
MAPERHVIMRKGAPPHAPPSFLERHNAGAPPVTWCRAPVPAACFSPALGENSGAGDGNHGSLGGLSRVLAW